MHPGSGLNPPLSLSFNRSLALENLRLQQLLQSGGGDAEENERGGATAGGGDGGGSPTSVAATMPAFEFAKPPPRMNCQRPSLVTGTL